jgi:hypothetical protein
MHWLATGWLVLSVLETENGYLVRINLPSEVSRRR